MATLQERAPTLDELQAATAMWMGELVRCTNIMAGGTPVRQENGLTTSPLTASAYAGVVMVGLRGVQDELYFQGVVPKPAERGVL